MPEKVGKGGPPRGFKRLLWRAPIWLYRLHLGGLLGGRFLLLHHTGRKSGLPRQNVLEVVDCDKATDTYMIAAGFGKKSDWYRNILQNPAVEIEVGRQKSKRTAVALSPQESGQAMVDYAHRNPRAAKELMRICGFRVDGSDEDYFILGREDIPFMRLELRK